MNIDLAEFDGPALLLQVQGRINILTADNFHRDILDVISDSQSDVIIDATEVSYLSTAGLHAFLLVSRELADNGRSLHLCSFRSYIQDIFTIIGFDKVIPIHPDIDSARAAIQSGAS